MFTILSTTYINSSNSFQVLIRFTYNGITYTIIVIVNGTNYPGFPTDVNVLTASTQFNTLAQAAITAKQNLINNPPPII